MAFTRNGVKLPPQTWLGYRGAGIACFREDKDGSYCVLLCKRKFNPYRGYWSFPGGGANPGEALHNCALREFTEETGKVLFSLDSEFLDEIHIDLPFFHWVTHVVRIKKNITTVKAAEFTRCAWVYPVNFSKLKLHPGVTTAIRKYEEHRKV
jgi:ADP-ribose pyrophosphatase YjhB (NUDIX family)